MAPRRGSGRSSHTGGGSHAVGAPAAEAGDSHKEAIAVTTSGSAEPHLFMETSFFFVITGSYWDVSDDSEVPGARPTPARLLAPSGPVSVPSQGGQRGVTTGNSGQRESPGGEP